MPTPSFEQPQYYEVIKRYKAKYPYLANVKLAEIICKNETLDKSVSYIRQVIPHALKQETQALDIDPDSKTDLDFELPESLYKERPPFILPKSNNNILVIGDIHLPFQNNEALRLTLRHAKERHINGIVLNGDIIDFYAISRFARKPDLRDVFLEVKRTKEFFEILRKIFPSIPIYYKIGNHEERWIHYIMDKAPELWNVPGLQFRELFDLEKYGIELIEDQRRIEAGQLHILHGHEFKMFSGGVNVARAARLKTLDNVLTHHFHQSGENLAPSISNKIQGGFSVGCLCGLSPDYMPINLWINGFAIVEIEPSGMFHVDNKKIINGRII